MFWDRRIPPGEQFAEYIERRLKECRVVVVLWSAHSVGSRWVWREARHGAKREPPRLIPAMISDAAIPFEFDDIQAADLTSWLAQDAPTESHGPDELLSAIDARAPRRVATRQAPEPVSTPSIWPEPIARNTTRRTPAPMRILCSIVLIATALHHSEKRSSHDSRSELDCASISGVADSRLFSQPIAVGGERARLSAMGDGRWELTGFGLWASGGAASGRHASGPRLQASEIRDFW